MAFQITGKIEMIGEIAYKASSNGSQPFQSREFILDATRFNPETGESWENHPRFELSSRNVNIIDGFQVGQKVVVDFVIRGAKYNDKQTGEKKYFTTISAFRITAVEQPQAPQYQPQVQQVEQPFPPQVNGQGEPMQYRSADLPF